MAGNSNLTVVVVGGPHLVIVLLRLGRQGFLHGCDLGAQFVLLSLCFTAVFVELSLKDKENERRPCEITHEWLPMDHLKAVSCTTKVSPACRQVFLGSDHAVPT